MSGPWGKPIATTMIMAATPAWSWYWMTGGHCVAWGPNSMIWGGENEDFDYKRSAPPIVQKPELMDRLAEDRLRRSAQAKSFHAEGGLLGAQSMQQDLAAELRS